MSTNANSRRGGLAYPERVTYYDNADGMAILDRLARDRGMKGSQFLRQLVREEAARQQGPTGDGDA